VKVLFVFFKKSEAATLFQGLKNEDTAALPFFGISHRRRQVLLADLQG